MAEASTVSTARGPETLAPIFHVDTVERVARLRSLALGARLICGPRAAHLEQALRNAEQDSRCLPEALALIDKLDALDRRRLLAAWNTSLHKPKPAA